MSSKFQVQVECARTHYLREHHSDNTDRILSLINSVDVEKLLGEDEGDHAVVPPLGRGVQLLLAPLELVAADLLAQRSVLLGAVDREAEGAVVAPREGGPGCQDPSIHYSAAGFKKLKTLLENVFKECHSLEMYI